MDLSLQLTLDLTPLLVVALAIVARRLASHGAKVQHRPMDQLPLQAETWIHRDGAVVQSGPLAAMIRWARRQSETEQARLSFSIRHIEGMRSWPEVARAAERYTSLG